LLTCSRLASEPFKFLSHSFTLHPAVDVNVLLAAAA
jgi:hypothetical protein